MAAGAVPLAHGNDGGGSIRIPAAVNGLVGLKPTRDRLAQDRLTRQMPVRIVSDGVLTRSVRDTAAFLREAEHVYRALRLPPIGDVTRPGRTRLRIAVHTSGIGRAASPEVAELTLKTARLLEELGHHVEQVDHPAPATVPDDFLLYWSMLATMIVRTGRRQLVADVRPDPPRQPHPRPGPALPQPAAPAPRRDRPAAPAAAGLGGVPPALRRLADAHARAHHAAGRAPRPDRGLRDRDGADPGLGGVHAVAERDRRPGGLAAARDHVRGAASGDDARRRCGPRDRPCWSSPTSSRRRPPGRGSRTEIGRPGSPISPSPRACVLFSVVAPLAQSAERLHGKEKVYGSIP